MFADPQSVTINAVAQSLPAIARTVDNSIYQKDDSTVKLTIAHQFKVERNRFTIRLDQNKTAADPLASANNKVYSQSVFLTMDKPVAGFNNADTQLLASALVAWLTSGNLLKVLGGET